MTGVALPTIEDHQRVLDELAALRELVEGLTSTIGEVSAPPLMLTTAQAVKYTGLSSEALVKLRKAGRIGWHDIEGSHRYSRLELDQVLAALTAPADPPARLRAVGT